MDLRRTTPRFSIFILLLIPLTLTIIACSTPAWFPIKKGPPHKAGMKILLDKEVVIIDKQEYIKVYNPQALEGGNQPKYLYIPVDEYLSKRETFTTPAIKVESKKEVTFPPSTPSLLATEGESFSKSFPRSTIPDLKRKVMIAQFDDRTTKGEEVLGDWVAEKLIRELSRESQGILFVDYQVVKDFLESRGVAITDLETPRVLHLLNEVFGVHALMVGELSGPYAFITKAERDRDETASAIIKIELRLVDTLSGKTVKTLSAQNPITAVREKGSFSEERAKAKAIDLTIADLSQSLVREVDGLDWFCRIAKVEGDEVYINAGRLTGLRVGDVMEVSRAGGPGDRGEAKGKIQISACFGIDASMGRLISGKRPDVNDILRLAKRKET
ncbi:MAG: hypothetical protein ABSB22_12540 [Thermodesulfobacteriota bacterium]